MPVRYSVTDSSGFVHTRMSRGHRAPQYSFAVVRWPQANKSGVSYHSTKQLAEKALREAFEIMADNSFTRRYYADRVGKPTHPEAKIYTVTAEIL
jgi:hypothetical protein